MLLMIFDSSYSVLAPFIWVSKIYTEQTDFNVSAVYNTSEQLFYFCNTLFSILIMYAAHNFQTESN